MHSDERRKGRRKEGRKKGTNKGVKGEKGEMESRKEREFFKKFQEAIKIGMKGLQVLWNVTVYTLGLAQKFKK